MANAYPLDWPEGQPTTRADDRQRSRFKCSFAKARRELFEELRRIGVGDWEVIISSNVELRRDGLPYSGRKPHGSPGVAVYFRLDGEQQCFACDRWDLVEDNLWAIVKTLDALRGIERWGSSDMVKRAFSGFKALPPAGHDWRSVLGLADNASIDFASVRLLHREKAKEAHPDQGGSEDEMVRLNQALEAAREELGA